MNEFKKMKFVHILWVILLTLAAMFLCTCKSESKSSKQNKRKINESADMFLNKGNVDTASHAPTGAIEIIDNIGLLKVNAVGFVALSSDKKRSIYTQFAQSAAQSSCLQRHVEDVMYCQVVNMIEEIFLHPNGVSLGIKKKLKTYLTQLWLHEGNRHRLTEEHIAPSFIPGELGAATQLAIRNGADIDVSAAQNVPLDANNIEQLEALLNDIRPYIFASKVDEPDKSNPTSSHQRDTDSADVGNREKFTDSSLRSVVYYEDARYAGILEKLRNKADYFDKKVREVGGTKSTAARRPGRRLVAAQVLDARGTLGPYIDVERDLFGMGLTSLTNDELCLLWLNVNETFETHVGQKLSHTFSSTKTDATLRISRRQLVSVAYYAVRELVGFGLDGTQNKESDWLAKRLGENASIVEALRADLAVLYLGFDPQMKQVGLLPDDDTRNALLLEYLVSTLESIAARRSPGELPFLMAKMMVLNYLVAAGVVKVVTRSPGEIYLSISDFEALRTPLIQMLGKVRNIRFFGDGIKADALVNQYGFVQAGWSRGLQARFDQLEMTHFFGVVFPVLEITGTSRSNSKVSIKSPRSFYERQISISAL